MRKPFLNEELALKADVGQYLFDNRSNFETNEVIPISTYILDPLLERVAHRLSAHWKTTISLHSPEIIKDWERNRILRCQISGETGGVYSSLIIKQLKQDQVCGYSDWAGLQFISRLQGDVPLAPQLYGGDIEDSFFVMEDLGPSKTLEDILNGTDPAMMELCCMDLVTKMARLHRITVKREEEYLGIRRTFPKDLEHGRFHEGQRWREGLKRVYTWFEVLDCPLPLEMETCFEVIDRTYRNPDDFLTFTHGDMAPSNNHIAGERVYLLDFEYGDFRHALYDLTAWYMLCPLPEEWVKRMKAHYRKEVSGVFPTSDDVFEAEWNRVCAWRGLALLSWIPHSIVQENRPWVGEWTMREAVLTTLRRLYSVCSKTEDLCSFAERVEILHQRLQERWGEYRDRECIPQWKVFQRYDGCSSNLIQRSGE